MDTSPIPFSREQLLRLRETLLMQQRTAAQLLPLIDAILWPAQERSGRRNAQLKKTLAPQPITS